MTGEELKNLRKENNLTQEELATLFNTRFETNLFKKDISQWENGRRKMVAGTATLFKQFFAKRKKPTE